MSSIKIKTVAIAASKQVCLSSMVVLLLVIAAAAWVQAQSYQVLHRFHGKADGATPYAGVIQDAAGSLYGTTFGGGDLNCKSEPGYGCGVVFKLSPTRKLTVLHTFTGEAAGGFPDAGLIRDAAGNLYGTAEYGGDLNCDLTGGCGVVFKLTGKETVLHSFTGGTDGGDPRAGVIRDAKGNLYGTTVNGGDLNCDPGYGCGVVFKLDTTGKETVLHAFTGGADGGDPQGVIHDTKGNLYGTTSGGGTYGSGVVFKLDTSGKETVLHSFTGGADGGLPYAGVIRDAAGNLYGTTYDGGTVDQGVVFKLDTSGKETVLHAFTGKADGGFPFAGLLRDAAGNLYGTTFGGGDSNCFRPSPRSGGRSTAWDDLRGIPQAGCGVVFKLTP